METESAIGQSSGGGQACRLDPVCGFILAAGALGIFLVPWYVPVTEPAMGQSYLYGFNNSVAILGVGATLAALFVYLLLRGRSGGERPQHRGAILETFGFECGRDRKLFVSFAAAACLSTGFMAGCYWYVPFDHWEEMGYFISRMQLLILKRAPYYDFPFPYGPAMVWIPYQFYRIARGHLSIEQAYCVILLLHWIIGLYVFAWCVRLLFPPSRRCIVFWVFALIFLNPLLGINYTPLRFVLPIAAVLFNHYAASHCPPRLSRGHLLVALAAFLGPFLNFELSPEMGLAVTAALVVYFVSLLRTPQRIFAHGAVMAVLGGLVAVWPWSTAYLSVLYSFGGAMSLPIFPGLGMLLFLAAVFFLLPRLAVIGVASREAGACACLGFCVLSGNLIVPALSRCDLGHVFLNGLAVFLFVPAVFARLPDPRWFQRAMAALFLVFAVLGNWIFLFHSSAPIKVAAAARSWMRSHAMPACQRTSHGFFFSKQYPPIEGLDPLLAYGKLAVPLGCSEDIEHFLLLHGRYLTGYNPGNCSDVRMMKQIARQERDVDEMRAVLVPKFYLDSSSPSAAEEAEQHASDLRFLRNESLFPLIKLIPRHARFDPMWVLAAHISRRFTTIAQFRDYYIMSNREGVAH